MTTIALDRASARRDPLAFDRGNSVRTFDADGHMRVDIANISKATVNPYFGSEIPGWREQGLVGDKVYKLLRDPNELAKAAPTFAGKPILIVHTPINADDHPREKVVGAIGTDVVFGAPFLTASLSIWDREAIDLIESGKQRALSCGYRYKPVWEPGLYEGEAYDARMTNIEANHLALVVEGRAGPDVVIGDEKPSDRKGTWTMPKILLSRKAALIHGALSAVLLPKIAKDAKPDFVTALAEITNDNFVEMKPTLAKAIHTELKGKLAKDATVETEDLVKLLEAIEGITPEEAEEAAEDADPDDDEEAARKKKEEEEKAAKDKRAKDTKTAKDKAAKDKAAKGAKDDVEADPDADRKTMDEATIKQAVDAAAKLTEDRVVKRMTEAAEAREFVRPWVGDTSMSLDTAEKIYRTAAISLKVPFAKDIKESIALKALISQVPKPGEPQQQNRQTGFGGLDAAKGAAAGEMKFRKDFDLPKAPRSV